MYSLYTPKTIENNGSELGEKLPRGMRDSKSYFSLCQLLKHFLLGKAITVY